MSNRDTSGLLRFPQLDELRLRAGKTKLQFAKDAGTSRNTLDKIIAGLEVRTGTLAIILNSLEEAGYDVASSRDALLEAGQAQEIRPPHPSLALASNNDAINAKHFAKGAISGLETAHDWLLKLERAVKQKDGSVSRAQIDEIENLTRRIGLIFEGISTKASAL
ncbi:MAG: hypothetical protein N4A61_01800 [Pelagimonas sp.]|jgi:transcriptional regulator with XRE-family HTH domain|nr:hypothetical protein [Pelagimonas sp.]